MWWYLGVDFDLGRGAVTVAIAAIGMLLRLERLPIATQ